MQKLKPKMFVLTTVHVIAQKDPLGINFFRKFFADVVFPPKRTLSTQVKENVKFLVKN